MTADPSGNGRDVANHGPDDRPHGMTRNFLRP
jgi:hypothetical protein